ncbi:hypothetical protein EV401DRAFT_228127 [Pisolithus croceorrhizus]|nr:hypothetical protein EV401DRAFT_228127 [Pisolithus croceorrhizus]
MTRPSRVCSVCATYTMVSTYSRSHTYGRRTKVDSGKDKELAENQKAKAYWLAGERSPRNGRASRTRGPNASSTHSNHNHDPMLSRVREAVTRFRDEILDDGCLQQKQHAFYACRQIKAVCHSRPDKKNATFRYPCHAQNLEAPRDRHVYPHIISSRRCTCHLHLTTHRVDGPSEASWHA